MLLSEGRKGLTVIVFGVLFFSAASRDLTGSIKPNTVLVGHVIMTLSARDIFSCSHMCLERNECESFNYGVESSKNGVCELNSGVHHDQEMDSFLLRKNGFVFVSPLRFTQVARSCLEHFQTGMTTSGFYRIQSNNGTEHKAYCDMTSEPNSAWTLVLSYRLKNASQFREPLTIDFPVSVDNPNWKHYRLSRGQMDDLKKISTHWRITCSFPQYGVDFRDYLRAQFSAFDPTKFHSTEACKTVELINIKGKTCQDCEASFMQNTLTLHHIKYDCYYGEHVDTAENFNEYFGNYKTGNVDNRFRCTSGPEETTNMWFGGYI